jgi:hypothetical protein
MMPAWAEVSNELLPNTDLPVKMAKCDVTQARLLGDRYEVNRYPGLIFLMKEGNGHKWYSYEGPKTTGGFMAYLKKMTSANIESIECDALQRKITEMNQRFLEYNSWKRVMVLFDQVDTADYGFFVDVARKSIDDFSFF